MTTETPIDHDVDQCGICLDRRAKSLRGRGVARRLVELLRTSLDARAIGLMETATADQIRVVNRAMDEWRP